jgi:hypothetical protein
MKSPCAGAPPAGIVRPVRGAAFAVLFVVAACGSSSATDAPKQIATSSTTAEEARAIDGPVMRYPDTSSTSKLSTLLRGVLQLEGDCLYLDEKAIGQHFPVLWPAGTRWDGPNQSVVSPAGVGMRIGGAVEGRGGYFYLSDVGLLAGTAASNLAARCVDNTGQIAVVENVATAISPTNN